MVKQSGWRGLRDPLGEGRWGLSSDAGCIDEDLNPNGASIDLDTLEGSRGLVGLVGLGEDDGCATQALSVGSILKEDLLGATNTNCVGEIVLEG